MYFLTELSNTKLVIFVLLLGICTLFNLFNILLATFFKNPF